MTIRFAMILLCISLFLICAASQQTSSSLSTFRVDAMKLKSIPIESRTDILSEAIFLMKNHFFKRHLIKDSDWSHLREAFPDCNNPYSAIRYILNRCNINDPYTRYLNKKVMTARKDAIRGERVSVGLVVKRRFYFNEIFNAYRHILNPYQLDIENGDEFIPIHQHLSLIHI